MDDHKFVIILDQTLCSVQSNFAAELSFEVFVEIHNSGWKAWLPGGLSTLLDWLLNDVEPVYSEVTSQLTEFYHFYEAEDWLSSSGSECPYKVLFFFLCSNP